MVDAGNHILQYEARATLANVSWNSKARPVAVTSKPIRLYTNFIILTFTELQEVSMELWHVSRERLLFSTPGSVPF